MAQPLKGPGLPKGNEGPMEPLLPGLFRIDREGNWYHQGVEVTHQGVYLYLYRLLQQEEESGRFFIQNEEGKWYVEVEDAPFVVTQLENLPSSGKPGHPPQFTLSLNDGTQEPLDPSTLWIPQDNIPHCRVKGGRFHARFNRLSYFKLAEWLAFDEQRETFYLPTEGGGRHYPILNAKAPGNPSN